MKRKTLILASTILFFILSVTACVYASSAPDGFAYLKIQHIIGSPDGTLSGYQMKFTIHSGDGIDDGPNVYLNGHSESWPGDIRFADVDGHALSYWLESYDAKTATVWVNVSHIPVSGTTIYLYYGKNDDHGASDGKSTFEFFDDFNGNTSGPNWNISGNGTCVVADGRIRLSASDTGLIEAHCQETIPSTDYVIETEGSVVTPFIWYNGVNTSYPSNYNRNGKYRPGLLFKQGPSPDDKAIGFDTWSYEIDGWTAFDFPRWSNCEVASYADIYPGDAYGGRFHMQAIVDGSSYTAIETLRNKVVRGTTDLDGTYFGIIAEKSTTDYDWVFVRNYTLHGPMNGAWDDGSTLPASYESWISILILLLLACIVILLFVLVVIGLFILLKNHGL
jgi:hypothetical protein